jgi:hypothetical protein
MANRVAEQNEADGASVPRSNLLEDQSLHWRYAPEITSLPRGATLVAGREGGGSPRGARAAANVKLC